MILNYNNNYIIGGYVNEYEKMATLGVTLLTGFTLTACGNAENSSNSKSSSKESSEVVKKTNSTRKKASSNSSSEKRDDANKILQAMDVQKLSSFNEGLLSSLNEDQGFANNGKKEYAYATYIDTLAYDHSRGLIVKVNSDFMGLNDAQKTTVGQGAQKLAAAQLVMDGTDVGAESSAVMTNIHYESERVGYSKSFLPSSFKWK